MVDTTENFGKFKQRYMIVRFLIKINSFNYDWSVIFNIITNYALMFAYSYCVAIAYALVKY